MRALNFSWRNVTETLSQWMRVVRSPDEKWNNQHHSLSSWQSLQSRKSYDLIWLFGEIVNKPRDSVKYWIEWMTTNEKKHSRKSQNANSIELLLCMRTFSLFATRTWKEVNEHSEIIENLKCATSGDYGWKASFVSTTVTVALGIKLITKRVSFWSALVCFTSP